MIPRSVSVLPFASILTSETVAPESIVRLVVFRRSRCRSPTVFVIEPPVASSETVFAVMPSLPPSVVCWIPAEAVTLTAPVAPASMRENWNGDPPLDTSVTDLPSAVVTAPPSVKPPPAPRLTLSVAVTLPVLIVLLVDMLTPAALTAPV